MNESNGHLCPECGTPRASDGSPDCDCARRASDAHLDTRTAEAAAAEDFDPLRIRPYVEFEGEGAAGGKAGVSERPGAGGGGETGGSGGSGGASGKDADGVPTVALPTVGAVAGEPSATDVQLFGEPAGGETRVPPEPGVPPPPYPSPSPSPSGSGSGSGEPSRRLRRRRRNMLLAGAGAVVGVVAVAGFTGGLFWYDGPERNGAGPEDVRGSVPDTASGQGAASVEPSGTTSSASPSPSEGGPTASPSASPAAPSASSAPSRSATPTAAPSAPEATGTTTSGPGESAVDLVLRFGDQGSEVTELQLRLLQLGLYNGEVDGNFTREVEDTVRSYQISRVIIDDESGVYGMPTRQRLEEETTEPRRQAADSASESPAEQLQKPAGGPSESPAEQRKAASSSSESPAEQRKAAGGPSEPAVRD